MQNTFSQSGNDSKWFSKKSFFRKGMWHWRPPWDPPPLHGKYHLKFHFDYLNPSLRWNLELWRYLWIKMLHNEYSSSSQYQMNSKFKVLSLRYFFEWFFLFYSHGFLYDDVGPEIPCQVSLRLQMVFFLLAKEAKRFPSAFLSIAEWLCICRLHCASSGDRYWLLLRRNK